MLLALGAATLLAAALAYATGEWRWRVSLPHAQWREWRSLGRLLLWFTWPALPLALWTLWRWRRQLASRHVALPLWFAAVGVTTTVVTPSSDRSLLLALPALATLAAFALPTLRRSVAALVDWFTLLFFTGSAIIIWVVWIAMQTGVPRQPAANVAKLAPGFEPHFSALAFAIALAATLAWAWLVRWRVGRHRAALWKSLVLPAGGAALSWLLLATLWLPLLDYARSYAPLVQAVTATMGKPACLETYGLNRSQVAAFEFHAGLRLEAAASRSAAPTGCDWLIADGNSARGLRADVDLRQWTLQSTVRRPADKSESVLVYRRAGH
jgi:4-amino-4-deoxy-L-arabinose transferase-like glycosyltransferase